MPELVTLAREGEIGIITVNNPPVNALSPGVPEGIAECLEKAAAAGRFSYHSGPYTNPRQLAQSGRNLLLHHPTQGPDSQ